MTNEIKQDKNTIGEQNPINNSAAMILTGAGAKLKPAIEAMNIVSKVPVFEIANTIAMHPVWNQLGEYASKMTAIAQRLDEIIPKYDFPRIVDDANALISSYNSAVQQVVLPIQQFISTISDPLQELFEALPSFKVEPYRKQLIDTIYKEVYEAKWFPHILWISADMIAFDILLCARRTKNKKNRIKQIDQIMFTYYTDKRVESIKKQWWHFDQPRYVLRIMHQAVQAYHRREWALTISALTPLWEGIINEKANDFSGRKDNKAKQYLISLIEANQINAICQSFYDEYIAYSCYSIQDVKKDVPGRNSIAHGWYRSYPSKKAALNAILFTDFLLNLEPLTEIERESQSENTIREGI